MRPAYASGEWALLGDLAVSEEDVFVVLDVLGDGNVLALPLAYVESLRVMPAGSLELVNRGA